MPNKSDGELYVCSFCGKDHEHVKKMITAGDPTGANICDDCLDISVGILLEEDVDLPAIVKRFQTIDLSQLQPVFTRRNFKVRNNHCFYLGPFMDPFNIIYSNHIAAPLVEQGISVERADEIFSTDVVIEDVWEGINCAKMVIADVTNKNPNVMYEVGMAHTIGKPVLLISQNADDLPFDLRHRRCIIYDYTPPGVERLQEGILATVLKALGKRPRRKRA